MVSGDAEVVRHAVVNEAGDAYARKLIEDDFPLGVARRWKFGPVQPPMQPGMASRIAGMSVHGGVCLSGRWHRDYEVLTAAGAASPLSIPLTPLPLFPFFTLFNILQFHDTHAAAMHVHS